MPSEYRVKHKYEIDIIPTQKFQLMDMLQKENR